MTPSSFNKITHWWLQAVTKNSSLSQNCWNVVADPSPAPELTQHFLEYQIIIRKNIKSSREAILIDKSHFDQVY